MFNSDENSVLSRSKVFRKLNDVLSDVSSDFSLETRKTKYPDEKFVDDSTIEFRTSFAQLVYRTETSGIEHVHIRCQPSTSFDPKVHTSLCEAVLGIYPDRNFSSEVESTAIFVRGVVEHRHRRIKTGDWLLAINDNRVDWNNLQDFLSKLNSTRKLRLTVRHPVYINSNSISSLQPPFTLPTIESKLITLPQTLDFIHAALFYEKQDAGGFELIYQQPNQKDIFFAAAGFVPTLAEIMYTMNDQDSPLRSVSINLDKKQMYASISKEKNDLYMVLIYPPIENLNISVIERQSELIVRLFQFLFGSFRDGIYSFPQSIEYFFQIFFYRFIHLVENSSSILKYIRLVDEFLPAQFDVNGACPKFFIHDQGLLMQIDSILNELECQNINSCSNDEDYVENRYRRNFFVVGSTVFYRFCLVTSHLTNELTVDIYRFLSHYGYLNINQLAQDQSQFFLFKEVFPLENLQNRKRSFLYVSSQRDLILAVIVETEYEQEFSKVSPDHNLIQQLKLNLNKIISIFPPMLFNVSPLKMASPTEVLKTQMKRTISMPSVAGLNSTSNNEKNLGSTNSLASSRKNNSSEIDLRASQLISQASSQEDLYKTHRNSSTSIDQNSLIFPNLRENRFQPPAFSTVFYYLDYQKSRGFLVAPYYVLNKIFRPSLLDQELFETIQRVSLYVQRKHFNRRSIKTERSRFSTKIRPIYDEIACQYSINARSEKEKPKKNDKNAFRFWIVARKYFHPNEHEFFVCYHDSISQNLSELAFTVSMTMSQI